MKDSKDKWKTKLPKLLKKLVVFGSGPLCWVVVGRKRETKIPNVSFKT